MFAFAVGECGMDHDKFWELSWFEWSLYARRFNIQMHTLQVVDEGHWRRFRIQWATFMNANFKKEGGGNYEVTDLIKFESDSQSETVIKYAEPDIEAIKRKYSQK